MTDTLVDTNVVLDVNGPESEWKSWSERELARAADEGGLLVNQVVYSELVSGYATSEDLNERLRQNQFRLENLPWDAAYLAGVVFLSYRQRGGARSLPLPDFYIGAHAAVRGYRLLTRDRGYYRKYFPKLSLVSPETHP